MAHAGPEAYGERALKRSRWFAAASQGDILEQSIVMETTSQSSAPALASTSSSVQAPAAGGDGARAAIIDDSSLHNSQAEDVLAGMIAQDSVLQNGDMLKILFTWLGLEDLCRVGAVCTQWRSVSASEEFWRDLDFENKPVRPDQVLALVLRHRTARSLNLKGVTFTLHSSLSSTLNACRQLSRLEIGKGQTTDADLACIATCLPELQSLHIIETVLGRPGEVVVAHNSITQLRIEGCHANRVVVRCPALLELSFRCSHLTSFLPACPQLQHLDMHSCQKMSDSAMRVALQRLTSLRSLDISHNLTLSDDTLRELGTACGQLTYLDASGCIGLALSAVPALESYTQLQELQLEGCALVTSLTLALPRLRAAHLLGCRALVGVDMRCPQLELLALGPQEPHRTGCGALKRVTLASDVMRKLSWRGFPVLESVSLSCPSLTDCDLSDCDSLRDDVLATLGDGTANTRFHNCVTGGCPRLRHLKLEGCEGLVQGALRSSSLLSLSMAGCKSLAGMQLACPALQRLALDECEQLLSMRLAPVGVPRLSLGTCLRLHSLSLQAPQLLALDLRGCGQLSELVLDCPSLRSLDATFCGQLGDAALAAALSSRPPLAAVVLSVCSALGPPGLRSLGQLARLDLLDISYTETEDLSPIFAACPHLRSLNLSSCRALDPAVLAAILPPPLSPRLSGSSSGTAMVPSSPRGCELASLTALDVSYCPLPTAALADILRLGSRFESVAINGCMGANEAIWEGLHIAPGGPPPPQHALTSLSCVGCKRLRSCCLGLQPVPGAAGGLTYAEVPTAVAGLRSLKLGLSGVRRVALALPGLTALDLNGATELRALELRCPALLSAFLQACRVLPAAELGLALAGCRRLEMLDAQHTALPEGAVEELRARCPRLRCLLVSPPQPAGGADAD